MRYVENEKRKRKKSEVDSKGVAIFYSEMEGRTTTLRVYKKDSPAAPPFTMLSDNVDALHARSGGMSGGVPSPLHAALGPRSCSGEGDGSGRTDPLRGGGDSTVICCGERSDGGGGTSPYGPCGGVSGGRGKENVGETTTSAFVPAVSGIALGGTVAVGVSPSR